MQALSIALICRQASRASTCVRLRHCLYISLATVPESLLLSALLRPVKVRRLESVEKIAEVIFSREYTIVDSDEGELCGWCCSCIVLIRRKDLNKEAFGNIDSPVHAVS